MATLTKEDIEQDIELKRCTFEALLLCKVSSKKGFSIDFFNSFISKNENGNYNNNAVERSFRQYLTTRELANKEGNQ